MGVRRVVTGHDGAGKAVFASDQSVEPKRPILMPSAEFYQLWGGDATPQFPDDGSMPDWRTYFPPVGGFRFGMFSVAPDTTAAPAEVGGRGGQAATARLALFICGANHAKVPPA